MSDSPYFLLSVSLEDAVDLVYLGFSTVSDKMSQNIFVNKIKKCRLGDSSIQRIHNWFNNYSKRVLTGE